MRIRATRPGRPPMRRAAKYRRGAIKKRGGFDITSSTTRCASSTWWTVDSRTTWGCALCTTRPPTPGGYVEALEHTGYTRFRRIVHVVINARTERSGEGAADEGVPGPIRTIMSATNMALDRYSFETVENYKRDLSVLMEELKSFRCALGSALVVAHPVRRPQSPLRRAELRTASRSRRTGVLGELADVLSPRSAHRRSCRRSGENDSRRVGGLSRVLAGPCRARFHRVTSKRLTALSPKVRGFLSDPSKGAPRSPESGAARYLSRGYAALRRSGTLALCLDSTTWAAVISLDAIALALVGPGGYSVDAYLFGRRVVVFTIAVIPGQTCSPLRGSSTPPRSWRALQSSARDDCSIHTNLTEGTA